MNKNLIALIIPTINRAKYVLNLLHVYKSLNQKIGIFIGDGSEQSISDLIELESITSCNLDIKYYHLPKLHIHHVQRFLIERAFEYGFTKAAFCGDDDFINPFMLDKCAKFLDENADYSSVQGSAYLGPHPLDWVKKNIPPLSNYWGSPEATDSSSVKRVCNLLDYYWVPHFSLKRTDEYLKILSKSYLDMTDHRWGEVLQSVETLALGKSAYINGLYMMRGLHTSRGLHSLLNWITSPSWSVQFSIFDGAVKEIAMGNIELEGELRLASERFVLQIINSANKASKVKLSYFENLINLSKNLLEDNIPKLKILYHSYLLPRINNDIYLNVRGLRPEDYFFISKIYDANNK